MMKNLILIFATVIGLFVTTFVNANDNLETKASLSGKVLDEQNNEPIAYVTVALYDAENKIAGGGISDENGKFKIKDVKFGEYKIEIQSIGFEKISQSISVNKKSIQLDAFYLQHSSEELDEVVVKGEKLKIQREIDKNVINISEEMASSGNSVSEILNTIPEISVDSQGKISLRGDTNVRILVDGKISQIDPSQLFTAIPISSIEKIEVITNPSAKYDPEGLSGIINVITKKNRMDGFNGSLYTDIGSREKNNNYLGLNYRVKKFNFFASGNYGNNRYETKDDLDRTFTENDAFLKQEGDNISRSIYKKFKVGADFFLDSTNTITFFYEKNGFHYTEDNAYWNTTDNININNERSLLDNANDMNSFSLNHRKVFTKGSLESDLFYQQGTVGLDMTNYITSDENADFYNGIKGLWNYFSFKVDYSQQINDKSSYEIGLKSEILDLDSEMEQTNPFAKYDYDYLYKQSIHSAYSSYSLQLGKLSIKAGLRAEMALIEGKIDHEENNETYTIDYKSLFPSLHLKHQLNDNNNLGFSYSRRISRPSTMNLLPMEIQSNSSSITVGNPALNPSYTNSISFDHGYYKNDFGLNTSVYVRHSTDIIRSIAIYDSVRNVTMNTYGNLGSSVTAGLSVSSNYKLFDWWKLDAGVNVFYLDISDTNENYTIPAEHNPFNWSAKLNSTMSLPKAFSLTVNGRYSSTQYDAQRINEPTYALSLSVQKRVFKNKGNITFKVDDIINSGYRSNIYGEGFQDQTFYMPERPIYKLCLSYNFGSQFKGRKDRKLHSSGGL